MDGNCRHVAGMAFDLCRPMRRGVSGHLLIDLTEALDDAWRGMDRSRYTLIHHRRATSPPLALLRIRDDNDPAILGALTSAIAEASGANQSVRGWLYIADSEDLDAIAARLGRCLFVPDASKRDLLLRWFDPRVLEHLPSILSPAQWAYFRRGIRDWATLDRHGTLAWAPAVADGPMSVTSALRLDHAQMQRLQRLEAVNIALTIHATAGGRVDSDSRELADTLVARFDREHATGYLQDRVVFTVHGLQIHPRFDHHPRIARALSGVRCGEAGLAQVLDAIDAVAWKRVVAELDPSPTPPTPKQGCLE